MIDSISKEILALEDKERAKHSQGFFKTGKGEYGEGDCFLGLTVPMMRQIAKKYAPSTSFEDINNLLSSKYHEFRLVGVLSLVYQYQKAKDFDRRQKIVGFYLTHTKGINNWDIVDASAHKILGEHCLEIGDDEILWKLSKSSNIWEQRMSIIANHAHVRKGRVKLIYDLSAKFIHHPHDLMHKASGWLLREAGKRDREGLNKFLDQYASDMPRTMLRYAIEKHSMEERKYYMQLKQ